jgi:hypothetical protein
MSGWIGMQGIYRASEGAIKVAGEGGIEVSAKLGKSSGWTARFPAVPVALKPREMTPRTIGKGRAEVQAEVGWRLLTTAVKLRGGRTPLPPGAMVRWPAQRDLKMNLILPQPDACSCSGGPSGAEVGIPMMKVSSTVKCGGWGPFARDTRAK